MMITVTTMMVMMVGDVDVDDDGDDWKIEFPGSDHSRPPPVEWRLSRVQQQFDGKTVKKNNNLMARPDRTHPIMVMMMMAMHSPIMTQDIYV